MLRRSIDTSNGLSGALGTVNTVESNAVTVNFDNGMRGYKISKRKSRFLVLEKFSCVQTTISFPRLSCHYS